MNESQSYRGQTGPSSTQQPEKDPCAGQHPKPNPDEPKKPSDCKPPCPADEDCKEKRRPCPCPPGPTCLPVDPCDELPPEPPDEDPEPTPDPTPESSDCGPIYRPTDQLAALQAKLVKSQKTLRDLQPTQLEVDDLKTRIQKLQDIVSGQAAAESDYKTFYRSIEVARSEVECFIPTVRCQLELKEYQKRCICDAIEKVDRRIGKAKREAERARLRAQYADRRHKRAQAQLEWAQKYYTFVATDLKTRVTDLKGQLADLKGKVDPAKDPCSAYFYLYELERLVRPCMDGDHPCWQPDLNVGTYIDCWHPDCYAISSHSTLAAFNDAEAAEKLTASQLQQANDLATTLETAAADAVKNRQADILNEIVAARCCDPDCKCAPKEGAGREAR
jgi:hypothetical protein